MFDAEDCNIIFKVIKKKRTKSSIYFICFIISMFVGLALSMALNFFKNSIEAESKTVPEAEKAQQINDKCAKRLNDGPVEHNTCYAKEFELITYNHDQDYAISVLNDLKKIDRGAVGCHFIAHGIGWGTYRKNPAKGMLETITPECSYGALHGFLEYYVANIPEGKITKENAPTLCPNKPNTGCSHALGHIFLIDTQGSIEDALTLCDQLKGNESTCYHGLFMEHHMGINLLLHGFAGKERENWVDLIYEDAEFCRQFTGLRFNACWGRLADSAYYKFNGNIEQIFNFCDEAEIQEAAHECKAVGYQLLFTQFHSTLEEYAGLCKTESLSDPGFEERCYSEYVRMNFARNKTDQILDLVPFCKTLNTPMQESCIQEIGIQLKRYAHPQTFIEKMCAPLVNSSLLSSCLQKDSN